MAVARVNGAITVVNAIASWKGAAIGVNFEVIAEARPYDGIRVAPDTKLVREAASLALKRVGGGGADVRVNSEIPMGWGLKSSSAVANAVVLSIMALHGRQDLMEALKISVEAARRAGVTVTGALDDSAASMLGGFVMTDNRRDELLMRAPIEERDVLILLPEGESPRPSASVDASKLKSFSRLADSIFALLPGRIWEVMTLNGLLYSQLLGYDPSPSLEAVRLGALAAGLSGTGPAVAAVCGTCDDVEELWSSLGRVLRRRITNRPAEISSK